MNQYLTIGTVHGLLPKDQAVLRELVDIFNYHILKNQQKEKYYDGKIKVQEVNLGIALPEGFRKLEIGCEWGAKCVDVLASRSMFDGFVSKSGSEYDEIMNIFEVNRFMSKYQKGTKDELKFGCSFVTMSADPKMKCKLMFHSPMTAAAKWDGEKGRIGAGIAIIDSVPDESQENTWTPLLINVYTDTDIIVLSKMKDKWSAEYKSHKMGRPLMVPFVWNPTNQKPFGRSRIKEPVRQLINGYVRTMANMAIALEFSTTPQKYLIGVSDKQYDEAMNSRFKHYVDSMFMATIDPETGEKPTYGQLSQGTISPHVEMIRVLATQYSAATGLSVTDTGVVNDANPTSSDAIMAQSQTLVLMAEQLNQSNGDSLRIIAQMVYAIANNMPLDSIPDEAKDIIPHFKNPAMPSVASTSDAAVKIASMRQEFASTDVYLEMVGFDQADIRRIKAQEQRARGRAILTEIEPKEVTTDEDINI